MIAFDMQCSKGHVFEGWFEDNNAYEEQKKKDLISCPACNNSDVNKVPTTFGVMKSTQSSSRQPQKVGIQISQAELEIFQKKFVEFVTTNSDNVGPDFAKEALKMHYGATEPRNIRGFSTAKEEKLLKNEGIQFFKLPVPEKPEFDA